MGRFTNGMVRYERTVKTGDYENKKAAAEISWTADEGEEDSEIIRLAAGTRAKNQVHAMLGLATVEFKDYGDGAGPFKSAELPDEVQAAVQGIEIPEPAKVEHTTGIPFMKKRATRKVASAEEPITITGGHPVPPTTEADVIAAAIKVEPAPVVEITDDQLVKALQATTERIKDAVRPREVLGKFVPTGFSFKDVEQKDRPEFLAQLKALS